MGDSTAVMEEEAGLAKIGSVASTGSLVQIDSIAIDIRSSMEPPKLEHFSIRQVLIYLLDFELSISFGKSFD